MSEQWKDMPGHVDCYLISDLGRVLSLCKDDERLLTRYPSPNGYRVTLYPPGGGSGTGVPRCVHRMVMLAFNPIPNAHQYRVLYKDEDMWNPRLSNLEWVRPVGAQAYGAKLTETAVREIKQIYFADTTLTQQAIAEVYYGVKREAINKILTGRTWGHVK